MNIYELADLIDAAISIKRYPNQKNRWTASFEYAEEKDGALLSTLYGDSDSPQHALAMYAKMIRGKTVVFSAMSKDYRRTYNIPENLDTTC